MSSTNRGSKRDSHISDYYVTPHQPIFDLFKALLESEFKDFIFEIVSGDVRRDLRILDPCAGGNDEGEVLMLNKKNEEVMQHQGANPMSYPHVLEILGAKNLTTVDIREDSLAQRKEDFFSATFENEFDLVITNPPFSHAEMIINRSLEVVKEGGLVIMLLRLNFFGSKGRKPFWEKQMPVLTFVHRERISFTKGATDSIEYMHVVFQKGSTNKFTKLYII